MLNQPLKVFINKYFKYLLLAALLYMPLFGHLDTLAIRLWDESRLAENSVEMLRDGDFIVTHFNGSPEMWNTKPPLMIWAQVLSMKCFGINDIAIRLPSAIAALLTCLVILVFSIRYLNQFWFGFMAVLVLITTDGYINIHAVRTGDYDSLLTLFTTLSGLLFFIFTTTGKSKYLLFFFISLTLAALTKGIASLLFTPAYLIYAIWQRKVLEILKNKYFYIGLASFLIIVLGYYLLREHYNPGYIEAVLNNELGGRYLKVNENHGADFMFYFNRITEDQLSYWYLYLPCGILIGLFSNANKINRMTGFLFLMIISFFITISSSETKLEYYSVPLFPFLAMLITVFLYYIYTFLKENEWINNSLKINIIRYVFIFLIFITPYQYIFNKIIHGKDSPDDYYNYALSYFIKENGLKGEHDLNNTFILNEGYNQQYLFYVNALNAHGVNISFKNYKELNPGEFVITNQQFIKEYITTHYAQETIFNSKNLVKYKITGKL